MGMLVTKSLFLFGRGGGGGPSTFFPLRGANVTLLFSKSYLPDKIKEIIKMSISCLGNLSSCLFLTLIYFENIP